MFKAGAGKACINPSPDMFPLPTTKSSDWGLDPITTDCVYDDMNCRAIAIETETAKLLILSYELPGIPTIDGIHEKIATATGFDDVIITATHNHTGYFDHDLFGSYEMTDEFIEYLAKIKKIELDAGIAAAKQAVAALRPAKMGYGETLSYCNTNRDLKTMHGYWVEARNLVGYSDKTVSLVKFIDNDDNIIAVLANYGCHATCGYLMQDFDGIRKTSGNFNGIASRFVEDHYGGDTVCLWTSGAAGNQNPLLSHGLQYEYPDGYTSAVDYPDGVGYMHMELMGRTHGADCVRGIDGIDEYLDDVTIRHIKKGVMLPAQKKIMQSTESSSDTAFRMGGRGIRNYDEVPFGQVPPVPQAHVMGDDPENPVELSMELIVIGNTAIVCANAELYAEIGRDMKAASPMRNTFVVTHTAPSVGYILDKTAAERDEKVFQAFGEVKPGAADDLIVKNELEMFGELGIN